VEDNHTNHIDQLKASIEQLTSRFDELASRLEHLEREGSQPIAPPKPAPASSSPDSIAAPHPVEQKEQRVTPPHIITARQNRLDAAAKKKTNLHKANLHKTNLHKTKPHKKPKPASFDFSKLEWFLGVRGLAILGMLIVVVGIGSFLKLAVDEGWIAAISPATRCAVSALFGLSLIGTGELLRRRINPLASSGISAAGIAVVYASILAATKLYALIDTPVAFILMALATITGILLGSLSNRVMLAMLSLIGAFAAPLLLSTGEPSFIVMPAYLVSLLVLGLGLSGWRGNNYSRVRQLAWWGTGLIGSLWLKDMYAIGPASSIAFVSTVWLVTVAELIASSRFFGTIRDKTKWPETSSTGFVLADSGERTFDLRSFFTPEARWINALFGVTAWAVTAAAITIRQINPDLDYLAPLSFAILSAMVLHMAFGFKRLASELWDTSATPQSSLASAMIINAALLGAATIATALGGWVQVVAWALVGLAAIQTAKRIRFRAAGLFGFAMIAVAIGRLLTHDFVGHLGSDSIGSVFGLTYTQWTPQIVFVAIICALAAWRSRYRVEGLVAASAVPWLISISLIHTSTTGNSYGAAILALSAIAGWTGTRFKIAGLRLNSYILAAIAMGILLLSQYHYDFDSTKIMTLHINPISMIIATLCWSLLAALPNTKHKARFVLSSLAITSGGITIAKLLETHSQPETLFVQTLYAGLIVMLGKRLFKWSLMEISSVLLYIIAVCWTARQISLGELAFEGRPFANLDFGAAIMTVALAVWAGLQIPKLKLADDAPSSLPRLRAKIATALFALAWVFLLTCTSLETVQLMGVFSDQGSAGGAAVSIWWSLFAIATIAAGFRFSASLRWAGLALLGIVAVKVLLVDTVTLNQGTRIIASISVGLVIIAAGVLYAKLVDVTDGKSENQTPDSDSATD